MFVLLFLVFESLLIGSLSLYSLRCSLTACVVNAGCGVIYPPIWTDWPSRENRHLHLFLPAEGGEPAQVCGAESGETPSAVHKPLVEE